MTSANEFYANQFHFHSMSEHTINGQRFDFEMHVVHFPKHVQKGIVASAIGIIFDT
ncbi:MAG: carbonic anhydrase family protein [bacterium]